jgi:hypothetical protein
LPFGGAIISEERIFLETFKDINNSLMNQLFLSIKEHYKVLRDLRTKVRLIFWTTLILYTVLFLIGIGLISIPIYAAYKGDISVYYSIIGGTFGITEIVALLMLKPVERIHNLMGDMSQITMALNSYQNQVALRILELGVNFDDEAAIDRAAEKISLATEENIKLIQKYVENQKKSEKSKDKKDAQK